MDPTLTASRPMEAPTENTPLPDSPLSPSQPHDEVSSSETEALKSAIDAMGQQLEEQKIASETPVDPPQEKTVIEAVTPPQGTAPANPTQVTTIVEVVKPPEGTASTVKDGAVPGMSDDVEAREAPIQRRFTTPDGQLITVIDPMTNTSAEATDAPTSQPLDETPAIIEQPVETKKEVISLDNLSTDAGESASSEKSTEVTNETILVKTLGDDVAQAVEQPAEMAEESVVSGMKAESTEEHPLETAQETIVVEKLPIEAEQIIEESSSTGTDQLMEAGGADDATKDTVGTAQETARTEEPSMDHTAVKEETAIPQALETQDTIIVLELPEAQTTDPAVDTRLANVVPISAVETGIREPPPTPIVGQSPATLKPVSTDITGISAPPSTPTIERLSTVAEALRTIDVDNSGIPAPLGTTSPPLQPKAASVFEYTGNDQPAPILPKRWSSVRNISTQVSTLPAIDPPAGVMEGYITKTETQLLLNRHLVPTVQGETHRITDQTGESIFHVIASSTEVRAVRTLVDSKMGTPILLIRPMSSSLSRLLGPSWSIQLLPLASKNPPSATLKRRPRWLHEYFGRPALFGSFLLYGSTKNPRLFFAKDYPLGVQGGRLKLKDKGEKSEGRVAAVVETILFSKVRAPASTSVEAKTFGITVAKGFDQALLCAVLVATDERHWWWEHKVEKVGKVVEVVKKTS